MQAPHPPGEVQNQQQAAAVADSNPVSNELPAGVQPTVAHATAATAGADTCSSAAPPPPHAVASSASSVDSSVFDDTPVTLEFTFGTYVGEVDPVTGLRSGRGTLTYTSGNVYDGEWRDGAANGLGEKRYANGDVYRGGWRDGRRCGRGGYLYAEGHYFEGHYEDDQPNGYGVLRTVGGDRYAGRWCNGRKDGQGRETLESGQIFIGSWRDGKKQGRGKLFLPGANSYIFGVWHDDRFFRELTEEEMGMDAKVDVVDEFGIPTTDRAACAPPPAPATAEGLGGAITDVFLKGVAAVEDRLEALGRALERVTSGGEAPASSGGPSRHTQTTTAPPPQESNEPATAVRQAMDP